MAALHPYRILSLPQPLPEDKIKARTLASKFQTLRLDSLQQNPEAFGSTYENEVDRTPDDILARWQIRKATQVIAVRATPSAQASDLDVLDELLNAEWVGVVVLVGPKEECSVTLAADPFVRKTAAQDVDATATLHYSLHATYVAPSARRAGLGLELLRRVLEIARVETRKLGRRGSVVNLAVNIDNLDARMLYEKAGFSVVGEERYTQFPRLIDGEMRQLEMKAWQMAVHLSPSEDAGDSTR